jgi:hypothetical protein
MSNSNKLPLLRSAMWDASGSEDCLVRDSVPWLRQCMSSLA